MIEEIAGWIAPIATMLAAMMTAANLGPRVTGWGFVVFSVGSVAWSAVAMVSGQQNLLLTNLFLTVVNLVGIWRWLGREARYDDGAKAAREASERRRAPTLFPVGSIAGRAVVDRQGASIGKAVGAMAECEGGRIAYLVVAEGGVGGVGERLHAVNWSDVRADDAAFSVALNAEAFAALPELEAGRWPDVAPPPASAGLK